MVMMVVIPVVMVMIPMASPWTVPRVVPSPVCASVPSSVPERIIMPRIPISSVVPRVGVPSGVVDRTVHPPAVSVWRPGVSPVDGVSHERVDVHRGHVGILEIDCQCLRLLRSCSRHCAVPRVEHGGLCDFRQSGRFLHVLCGLRRGGLFRPGIVDPVVLADRSLCRRSTGRRHRAACRQRNDSRHS